jgi:hypothetical protein
VSDIAKQSGRILRYRSRRPGIWIASALARIGDPATAKCERLAVVPT